MVLNEGKEQWLDVQKMSSKDANGQKRTFNYIVEKEQPADWFFAKKLAEVLPKWKFAPATLNGKPVKALLPFTHAFCLSDECREKYKNFKRHTNTKDTTLAHVQK
jgi:hypothetical protein